jgi:ABC-type uncharacterized transport system permease subunit
MSAEAASPAPAADGLGRRVRDAVLGASARLTLLAVVAALGIGAVVLALSAEATREALDDGLGPALVAGGGAVGRAYAALLQGSVGSLGALSETLVAATVLILTGLAVAVPLRAGLFNIGGEGQVIAGGLVGGAVGFAVTGLPAVAHLPLAIVAAAAGGAVVGWLPGFL